MKKIEIIATGINDIISLNQLTGPIEIELCGHMDDDGLTLEVNEIINCVNKSVHPIRVMIRTHNNGFNVTSVDVELMLKDIEYITKHCQPTGFVYGFLNDEQNDINVDVMKQFMEYTKGFDNTFHKAIDRIIGQDIITSLPNLGINQILTQGGLNPVIDNLEMLSELVDEPINIVVGGGVTIANYQSLIMVANKLHFGRAVRIDNSYDNDYDKQVIKKIIADISVV